MSAVSPLGSGALGSQPSRSSASTTSVWPFSAASTTAGHPSSFLASTLASYFCLSDVIRFRSPIFPQSSIHFSPVRCSP